MASNRTLEECQLACQATLSCTAINVFIDRSNGSGCVLRACSLPVSPPTWFSEGYEGYYKLIGKSHSIHLTRLLKDVKI